MSLKQPSPETLRELAERLSYDPETGVVTWVKPKARWIQPGTEAGYRLKIGYRRIELNGRSYATVHVAWFLHYGEWPDTERDHENRIKDDNRISNIRPATRQEQTVNTNMRVTNTSGFTGVVRAGRRWRAQINVEKRRTSLGMFDTPEEAARAYDHAARAQHGTFARTNFA